jgi:hypothetical protein
MEDGETTGGHGNDGVLPQRLEDMAVGDAQTATGAGSVSWKHIFLFR